MADAGRQRRGIHKVAGDTTLLMLFGVVAMQIDAFGSGIAYHMRDPLAALLFVGVRASAPVLMVIYPAALALFFAWAAMLVVREVPRLLRERNPYLDAGHGVAASFAALSVLALYLGAQTFFALYLWLDDSCAPDGGWHGVALSYQCDVRPEFYGHIGLSIDQFIRGMLGDFTALIDTHDPTDVMVQTPTFIVVKAFYKLLCATAWIVMPVVMWRAGSLLFRRRATENSSQRRSPI